MDLQFLSLIHPFGTLATKEASKNKETKNQCSIITSFKTHIGGLPGGAVVKNPPNNAGNTSSSPGPERSHMPRSN